MRGKLLLAAGLLCGAALFLSGCSVAQSYVDKVEEKLSADSVEKLWDGLYKDWNALNTTAANACLAQDAVDNGESGPVLVENGAMAYIATYRNVVQHYNASQQNLFEGKALGPPDLPKAIPVWPETVGADPDFCTVTTKLADLYAAVQ